MGFDADYELIRNIALHRDPAFDAVNKADLEASLRALEALTTTNNKDHFILSAMRVLALADNGHTRIIPNTALSIVPYRFVALGPHVFLTDAPEIHSAHVDSQVLAINETSVEDIFRAALPYLAGTHARQRVIFPILLAWPGALSKLGFSSAQQDLAFSIKTPSGALDEFTVPIRATIPAAALYPTSEHGWPSADASPEYVTWSRPKLGVQVVALKSFFDPEGKELIAQINEASTRVAQHPEDNLILDLRGNTGGDFTKSLPLLDMLQTKWHGTRCVALVDKFTFSAAIVCVALLSHNLKDRLTLIGEEMVDSLCFHAEGDTIRLPDSGALLRYSDAFHDWENGTSDQTTPANIKQHLVKAGPLPHIQSINISAKERRHGPDLCMEAAMAILANA